MSVSTTEVSAAYIKELEDQSEWVGLIAALEASSTDKCVYCGLPLGGLLFSTFRWGIVHGEGECGDCGFPYRLYHRFPTATGYNRKGQPLAEVLLIAFVPLADIPLQEPVGG